jgi:hypothetical protein
MANAIICCFTGTFVKTLLVNACAEKETIQYIVEECPLTTIIIYPLNSLF